MSKTRFEQMQDQLCTHLSPEQGPRVRQAMAREYEELSAQYAQQPKDMENHTQNNIFPVVTAYHALLAEGMAKDDAVQLANDSFLELMEPIAETIRKALKFPGLYRLMPWLWKTLMPKLFSPDAGFRFTFYPSDRHQVKFDMQACPYYQVCQELGCPELGPTFCATDDTCYGHMHPKLIWNRTQTIARGADCCDFDLYIPQK